MAILPANSSLLLTQGLLTATSAAQVSSAESAVPVPAAEPSGITLKPPSPQPRGRVLIFVESFFGFGHFNIVDLLAKNLSAQGVEVGVASSTFEQCGTSFDFGGAIRFALPALGVNAEGQRCKPDREPYREEKDEYSELIYRRTREIMTGFDPHLIVYELYPFMMRWRDASTRAVNDHYLESGRGLPERVSLCRDIIHSNKPHAVLKRLDTYCTRLMVRGDSRFARLEESQPEWRKIGLPIHYVGNFAAEAPRIGAAGTKDEVVIFSGGGYRTDRDTRFLDAVAGASRYTEAFRDKRFKIIISDGTPESVVERMLSIATDNCEIMPPLRSDVFKQMIAGAAAVVTRAGYNTCFELVRMQKPFVVIPRDYQEQRLRAAMLERSGYGRVVREDDLSAQAVARSLDTLLHPVPMESIPLRFDGAERMALALAGLLDGQRTLLAPAG